jgi:hypothetical protein
MLIEFRDWEVVVAIDVLEFEGTWPEMGLVIRAHEIVDGLRRDLFPEKYRNVEIK